MQASYSQDSFAQVIQMYSPRSKVGLQALMDYYRRVNLSLSRTSFVHFVSRVMPEYQWAIHNIQIAMALQMVADGLIRFLMIQMPPRHGKTELSSIQFPKFVLGLNPRNRVVLGSYSMHLGVLNSRSVRDGIEGSEAYAGIFPFTIINDMKRSEREWETITGGGVRAVGVGSSLTGFGADYMILDDLVKDLDDANSPTIRENTLGWYKSVARTRLQPGGSIVMPYTSWHEQDPGHSLLQIAETEEFSDKWWVLRLAALAEEDDPLGRRPGEALWPAMYPARELMAIQAADPLIFSALYQQWPQSGDSKIFNVDRIEWRSAPQLVARVRSWDLAVTEEQRSDWTVGTLAGFQPVDEEIWQRLQKLGFITQPHEIEVHDVIRRRAEWPEARQLIYETAVNDGPGVAILLEDGALNTAPVQDLRRDLSAAGFEVRRSRPDRDKVSRAARAAVAMRLRKVAVVRGAWSMGWLRRFDQFPQVNFDDEIDSFTQLYNMAVTGQLRAQAV